MPGHQRGAFTRFTLNAWRLIPCFLGGRFTITLAAGVFLEIRRVWECAFTLVLQWTETKLVFEMAKLISPVKKIAAIPRTTIAFTTKGETGNDLMS